MFDHRIGSDEATESLRLAREILEQRGGAFRANRNAAILVAADAAGIVKARASARTLGALRELKSDKHRLQRFNAEQREQLDNRLTAAEERLPQQVVMAYRHLLLLGEGNEGGTRLDHIDLGPARIDAKIGDRVLDYLQGADRLVGETLAPAALLADRFGLLPEGTDAVELDSLLGYFYRLPRLPKLAGAQVLRSALAEGVAKGLFGLASGASWDAGDAVLRFGQRIDPNEIQFQPGTFLVRASAMKELLSKRGEAPEKVGPEPAPEEPEGQVPYAETGAGEDGAGPATSKLASVTLRITGIPGSKARDVVKVAILPLGANAAD